MTYLRTIIVCEKTYVKFNCFFFIYLSGYFENVILVIIIFKNKYYYYLSGERDKQVCIPTCLRDGSMRMILRGE